jgi:2-iminobutanoate/2-iminopropanoate deaminase
VATDPLLFLSGQIGLDPQTDAMAGATVAEQTRQAFTNMRAVLASQGLTVRSLVKVNIFLTDMGAFSECNAVYEEELEGWRPARSVVEVSALPMGALVEIEGVACR